ncbi:hypothetical protein LR68_04329 [Anoxybacillus sp. BCO1]|nr:hypothetical protein LR68_04329 [Anoxybacillus sp. BCO1]
MIILKEYLIFLFFDNHKNRGSDTNMRQLEILDHLNDTEKARITCDLICQLSEREVINFVEKEKDLKVFI